MKKELLVVTLSLGCSLSANALPPQGLPGQTQPSSDLDGTWRLESAHCTNGSAGKLRYDSAQVRFLYGTVNADLITEGCEINIDGNYSTDGQILTTEFNNGTWASCSGALPTYILNRHEFRRERDTLVLTGTDLSPFAICNGDGELRFIAE